MQRQIVRIYFRVALFQWLIYYNILYSDIAIVALLYVLTYGKIRHVCSPLPINSFQNFTIYFLKNYRNIISSFPNISLNFDWKYIRSINNLGIGIFKSFSICLSQSFKVFFVCHIHSPLRMIKKKALKNCSSHIKKKQNRRRYSIVKSNPDLNNNQTAGFSVQSLIIIKP